MDQSEIPNAEQIPSALKKRLNQFSYLTSGVSRWGSLEPSFEPKLFHFHWDIFYYFRKKWPSFKKMFAVTQAYSKFSRSEGILFIFH